MYTYVQKREQIIVFFCFVFLFSLSLYIYIYVHTHTRFSRFWGVESESDAALWHAPN